MISFVRSADGVATGSVTGSATDQAGVTALVEAADAAARAASPAEDAADLVRDAVSPDWDDAAGPHRHPRVRRLRAGARRGLRPRGRRATGCSTGSSTTR